MTIPNGFIAEEYDNEKTSIFRSPLRYSCLLDNFNESMDYYFEVFRFAGKPIGFHEIDLIAEATVRKNEKEKILSQQKES